MPLLTNRLAAGTVLSVLAVMGQALASTGAHEFSRFAIIDPIYDVMEVRPAVDIRPDGAPWLYGVAELETWRLEVLRRRVGEAKLHANYPGTFHKPSSKAVFSLSIDGKTRLPDSVSLRAIGDLVVTLGDHEIFRAPASDAAHVIKLPRDHATGQELRIALSCSDEPPAILIGSGPLETGQAAWRWTADGEASEVPQPFAQARSGLPPHCVELPEVELTPVSRDGDLFDMGRLVIGRVTITAAGKPRMVIGESKAEARNDNPRHHEQTTELRDNGDGTWTSMAPLAFQYVRVLDAQPSGVRVAAQYGSVRYRGAFACSDERLTRVWMTGAYTLRLCYRDFLIDGVKRDRLPWVGDLAMSLLANAYSFGDGEIVRRSLVALGRAGIEKTHLNGIVDYSMWWIISQDLYQLYYSDRAHLGREWTRIQDTVTRLAEKTDEQGLYRTQRGDWVFVDWVSQEKQTALQIVWWWAQVSAANLAERKGDLVLAKQWRGRADLLAKTLRERAWDASTGSWRGRPDGESGSSRHANIYAVVSGLADPSQYPGILAALQSDKTPPVGTPYVAGFENMALARLGAPDEFVRRVDAVWGGMLDRGATTFWEAWNAGQKGDDAYGFYNRPYAKSLCHAWSAGPTAFLPSELLGLRPVCDGWERFIIEPRLGSLAWVRATVPTPHGEIEVHVEGSRLALRVPAGAVAVFRGRELFGPASFNLEL